MGKMIMKMQLMLSQGSALAKNSESSFFPCKKLIFVFLFVSALKTVLFSSLMCHCVFYGMYSRSMVCWSLPTLFLEWP